ncbi:MAG: RNase adapter RapZ [Acetobacteraceae bacterium]|nr:RNase adapter RapZ [Acetobacteraceae bacterium]
MSPPGEGVTDATGADAAAEADQRPRKRPFVIVTGLSGGGKAAVRNALEDLGYETVDNPPLAILPSLVSDGSGPIAVGIDTRTRGFEPEAALAAVEALRAQPGIAVRLVYVTADETVLQRRYTETRRRHPLAPGGPLGTRVVDGIARESALLAPLREAADVVIDTSELPLHAMRRRVELEFRPDGAPGLAIQVQSFAFPRGVPREADLVFDLRFLRNPHYDPVLRPLTGHDPAVAAHVRSDPDFAGFWTNLTRLLDPLLPRYEAEGKKYLTIAMGCTGGRHRSVFAAELLAAHLRAQGWRADSAHRELTPGHDIDPPSAAPIVAASLSGPPPSGAPGPHASMPSVSSPPPMSTGAGRP